LVVVVARTVVVVCEMVVEGPAMLEVVPDPPATGRPELTVVEGVDVVSSDSVVVDAEGRVVAASARQLTSILQVSCR
jgi:hypothetical protein